MGAVCECDWRTKSSQCVCVSQCGEVDFWRLRDVRETKWRASSVNCNSMGAGKRRRKNIIIRE